MTLQKINSVALDCCGCAPSTNRTLGSVFGAEIKSGWKCDCNGRVDCTRTTEKSSQRD